MQVPTYAKYLKDILGNKKVLPTTEVVQLTNECSTAILIPLLEKKKKPGCPTITCSIGAQHFKHALCDLRASISVMSKLADQSVRHLAGIAKDIPLADSTIRYPEGIAKNVLVRVRDSFVLADFVVMDIEGDLGIDLILGQPFLRAARARIDIGRGEICFRIGKEDMFFKFKQREEHRILNRQDDEG
ncbi:uncharacterized protein LOC120662440 [Panicum virgatum]|uniref:uncharacterized protein LOC120662440 n=1 Tax=Panicum virgatum TaxID=38727 RepID=UPI0019D643D6|nr:uncharacterized protein LOC120662440 [Panicum virgatum]